MSSGESKLSETTTRLANLQEEATSKTTQCRELVERVKVLRKELGVARKQLAETKELLKSESNKTARLRRISACERRRRHQTEPAFAQARQRLDELDAQLTERVQRCDELERTLRDQEAKMHAKHSETDELITGLKTRNDELCVALKHLELVGGQLSVKLENCGGAGIGSVSLFS